MTGHIYLRERDAQILDMYKKGHTLNEIADQFLVTQQRINQIVMRDAPLIMRSPGRPRGPYGKYKKRKTAKEPT
jgi:hypothetical protein